LFNSSGDYIVTGFICVHPTHFVSCEIYENHPIPPQQLIRFLECCRGLIRLIHTVGGCALPSMLCEPDHISGRICLLHQHHHLGRVGVENIMLSRVSGLAPKWPAMTRIFVHQKSFAFLSQHTSCHVRYMKTIQSHPSNSFDFWSAAEV
jgi:hypothetical protein